MQDIPFEYVMMPCNWNQLFREQEVWMFNAKTHCPSFNNGRTWLMSTNPSKHTKTQCRTFLKMGGASLEKFTLRDVVLFFRIFPFDVVACVYNLKFFFPMRQFVLRQRGMWLRRTTSSYHATFLLAASLQNFFFVVNHAHVADELCRVPTKK